MKADRDQLAEVIGRVIQGLPQAPVIPVRAGMLIRVTDGHAHLTCGDQDALFTARCPADGDGDFLLPGKMLAEVVRYLPHGEVSIEPKGNQVTVTCGRSSFTLSARPGSDYPQWDDPPAPLCTLDGAVLAAGLRKVAPAASDDLPMLSGILVRFGEPRLLTLVATDKYKLGTVKLAVEPVRPVQAALVEAYLPSRVAEKFARTCEGQASMGWNDSLISLQSEGLLVTVRQVAGQLPAGWQNLAQGGSVWYGCETAELVRAVRMASLAAVDDRITLAFRDSEIEITAGGASMVIPSDYNAAEVTLAVGGRNLLAGLAGCGELVRLSLSTSLKPLLLDSDGLRWLVQTRKEN